MIRIITRKLPTMPGKKDKEPTIEILLDLLREPTTTRGETLLQNVLYLRLHHYVAINTDRTTEQYYGNLHYKMFYDTLRHNGR